MFKVHFQLAFAERAGEKLKGCSLFLQLFFPSSCFVQRLITPKIPRLLFFRSFPPSGRDYFILLCLFPCVRWYKVALEKSKSENGGKEPGAAKKVTKYGPTQ